MPPASQAQESYHVANIGSECHLLCLKFVVLELPTVLRLLTWRRKSHKEELKPNFGTSQCLQVFCCRQCLLNILHLSQCLLADASRTLFCTLSKSTSCSHGRLLVETWPGAAHEMTGRFLEAVFIMNNLTQGAKFRCSFSPAKVDTVGDCLQFKISKTVTTNWSK